MPVRSERGARATLKRVMDIVLSLLLLVLLSPVLVLAAAAVWLEYGRPVLFRQRRVGRHFLQFEILKFRTMSADNSGPLVTVAGDKRVTRVGHVLRQTKIDELPQLWNVLRGEMSLVGPRPEVPHFVELFHDRYRAVLEVRPGITDLASIKFRHEEAILARSADPEREYGHRILPAKLDLAEQYVEKRSILGDIAIIAKTLQVTLFGNPSIEAELMKGRD
jgi:lipopolysaccharide/colanic/teichoic acid biosynthesis glycosyltransferase